MSHTSDLVCRARSQESYQPKRGDRPLKDSLQPQSERSCAMLPTRGPPAGDCALLAVAPVCRAPPCPETARQHPGAIACSARRSLLINPGRAACRLKASCPASCCTRGQDRLARERETRREGDEF